MTNEEIICEWMERKPTPMDGWRAAHLVKKAQWWLSWQDNWEPIPLTLDRLREVEKRLTDEQWDRYRAWFTRLTVPPPPVTSAEYFRMVAQADAAQKIKALAAVLREVAQAGERRKE